MEIKPGFYILRSDVENPKPDRRSTNWDKLPVWKAGQKVWLHKSRADAVLTIQPVGVRHSSLYRIHAYESQSIAFNALVAALEPIPEDFDCLCERLDLSGYACVNVIDTLVQMGKLTHADIEAAHAAWLEST